jgi:uncharacterized damage-inducible protein DinB
MMTVRWLRRVLRRDLATLQAQLDAYGDEQALWRPVPGIMNSGGTLALHLAGNVRHFIGAQLGGTRYVRDRDAEFTRRDVPRSELRDLVAAARVEVDATLARLDDDALDQPYPVAVGGARLSTGQFLVHLATHFAYHLGQLDYHRRVVTGGGAVPGMQGPAALAAQEA